ncbi:MarR family transcriptional regulator [Pelomonas sp. CA6]|uniref:MarR family winged helix-turn-helix transcriptional regulator n=1 Tax=Pelomonas sp. CA6 TaxID=2907999 RepID=UPI001F4BD87F|nr:MarR family transcriptional regulator [Pelomonas sp. CA6]MCH7345354.1 MarR family transcriptional regulator [Pelomonas sp. CA6]
MSIDKPSEPARFYRADSFSSEESLGWLMRQIKQSMVAEADRVLGPHDLTHAQWPVLLRLRFGGPTASAALARDLAMDGGAMTRLLDRLEAKGLIQRERSSEDRRVVTVSLSEAGHRRLRKAPEVLSEVFNAHLAGFTETEFRTLIHLLQRMVANGQALAHKKSEEASDDDARS